MASPSYQASPEVPFLYGNGDDLASMPTILNEIEYKASPEYDQASLPAATLAEFNDSSQELKIVKSEEMMPTYYFSKLTKDYPCLLQLGATHQAAESAAGILDELQRPPEVVQIRSVKSCTPHSYKTYSDAGDIDHKSLTGNFSVQNRNRDPIAAEWGSTFMGAIAQPTGTHIQSSRSPIIILPNRRYSTLLTFKAPNDKSNYEEFDIERQSFADNADNKGTSLGKTFLGLTVQAGVSLLAYAFNGSSSTNKNQAVASLLYFVVAANALGFLLSLTGILIQRQKKKESITAGNITEMIGAVFAAFGFFGMMGMLLPLKFIWVSGLGCLATLFIFGLTYLP